MTGARVSVGPVDPFDLPEWIGESPVTWRALTSLDGSHLVSGELHSEGPGPDGGPACTPPAYGCDLLACDRAYPAPVLDEAWRHDAHQAWQFGEVLLIEYAGRLTLTLPGSQVTADGALDALRRLARAVGAPASRITVALRL